MNTYSESDDDSSNWSYDSEEVEIIDNIYFEDESYQNIELVNNSYILGLCKYYYPSDSLLLINKISVESFFKFLYEDVLAFLMSYSLFQIRKKQVDIIKLVYSRDNSGEITYTCVVKSHYIRLIQRRWKRIMKERKNIMKWRMNPMYLQERCIYGRWVSDKVNRLPTIHGMLSEIKNNVSIYQE